jgi:uncharacterized membrane protein
VFFLAGSVIFRVIIGCVISNLFSDVLMTTFKSKINKFDSMIALILTLACSDFFCRFDETANNLK